MVNNFSPFVGAKHLASTLPESKYATSEFIRGVNTPAQCKSSVYGTYRKQFAYPATLLRYFKFFALNCLQIDFCRAVSESSAHFDFLVPLLCEIFQKFVLRCLCETVLVTRMIGKATCVNAIIV